MKLNIVWYKKYIDWYIKKTLWHGKYHFLACANKLDGRWIAALIWLSSRKWIYDSTKSIVYGTKSVAPSFHGKKYLLNYGISNYWLYTNE